MKLGTRPTDKVNSRLRCASSHLRAFGWTRGTHGRAGEATDLAGALRFCAPPDGYEIVAQRMLASRGHDTAWNDLEAQNVFEVIQALDVEFTDADIAAVYGRNWYAVVGIMAFLTTLGEDGRARAARHIGPAEESAVAHLIERAGPSPAYEDAHLLVSRRGFNASVWMLTDALVANCLTFPDIDDTAARLLAPVAEGLGL